MFQSGFVQALLRTRQQKWWAPTATAPDQAPGSQIFSPAATAWEDWSLTLVSTANTVKTFLVLGPPPSPRA